MTIIKRYFSFSYLLVTPASLAKRQAGRPILFILNDNNNYNYDNKKLLNHKIIMIQKFETEENISRNKIVRQQKKF